MFSFYLLERILFVFITILNNIFVFVLGNLSLLVSKTS